MSRTYEFEHRGFYGNWSFNRRLAQWELHLDRRQVKRRRHDHPDAVYYCINGRWRGHVRGEWVHNTSNPKPFAEDERSFAAEAEAKAATVTALQKDIDNFEQIIDRILEAAAEKREAKKL